MLNLFKKKSKVKEGKQTQTEAKAQDSKKKESPILVIQNAWKKLNSMDRKQAYTWGAVVLVGFIGLLILFSAASSNQEDDFSDFETRGYDLANMPFSSDEAEQYLLANKYPDMKEGNEGMGLYSEEEKEARQEEDAANAELDEEESTAGNYREGRYYGGGSRVGSGTRTKVGSLSSASLKGASGSGIGGKFGPSGDFSNFRSQNKGNDRAPGKGGRGTGNARTALRQTAMASRAAAGLKNDKLLNAKKALMGGTVDGSGAFMDDSGAVNLGDAKGLELDTNAPVSSADLSGLDDKLQDAHDDAASDAENDDKQTWQEFFRELAQEFIKQTVQFGMQLATSATNTAMKNAMEVHRQEAAMYQAELAKMGADYKPTDAWSKCMHSHIKNKVVNDVPIPEVTGC